MLRQLESILSIHKLARLGNHVDALREVARLPFLPLDPRGPDIAADVFENLSPHVQACIPDLLKVSLTCVDNVTDSDGSLRALRAKVLSRGSLVWLIHVHAVVAFVEIPSFTIIVFSKCLEYSHK